MKTSSKIKEFLFSYYLVEFLSTAFLDKTHLFQLGSCDALCGFSSYCRLNKSEVMNKQVVLPPIHLSPHLSCPRAPPLCQSTAKCGQSWQNKLPTHSTISWQQLQMKESVVCLLEDLDQPTYSRKNTQLKMTLESG